MSKLLTCGDYTLQLVSPVLGKLSLMVRDTVSGDGWLMPVHPLSWYWWMESSRPVSSSAWLHRVLDGDDAEDGDGEGLTAGVGHGRRSGEPDEHGRGNAGVPAAAAASADVGATERRCSDLPTKGGRSVGDGEGQC